MHLFLWIGAHPGRAFAIFITATLLWLFLSDIRAQQRYPDHRED